MSLLKTEIRAELYAPDGKLIRRYPWKRANSLLKAFIQLLAVQISALAHTIKDTGGVDRSISGNAANFHSAAGIATISQGVLIGTGTTSVTMLDFKLETQVTTNITHSVSSFAVENPSTGSWRLALSRGFTNNTGATLEVRESAIYCYGGGFTYFFCIDRTLYSVSVPNGVTLTLTYRITVTL